MIYFALAAIAAVLSFSGVALLRQWALRHAALDIPNARSSHTQPTPRGGGLAIAAVTLGGWLSLAALVPSSAGSVLVGYAAGAALIAAVSWLDDLHSLSSAVRFAVHIAAAGAAIAAVGFWETLPLPFGASLHLGLGGAALTLVWIVGLTNAYNFMDGSDGIAASQGLIAGTAWACLGWIAGDPLVAALGALLAAGCLGFLVHNWPPARIFMGDVGSAFLGYSFALLPLVALGSRSLAGSLLPAILPVWPFLFDASFTFLRRAIRGENVFAAHRSHLYQRLLIAGHSHRFVLVLYAALAGMGAAAAVLWTIAPRAAEWGAAAGLPLLGTALWLFVVREERREETARGLVKAATLPSQPAAGVSRKAA